MENNGMKDMITALTGCGFEFDMAIILAENYQADFCPILQEQEDEHVDRVS